MGIAKALELDTHAIHQREVKAARFALFISALGVVERAAGLESAAETIKNEGVTIHRNGKDETIPVGVKITSLPRLRAAT